MEQADIKFNEKAKVNEMLERMKSLAKSTIEEFKIDFEVGKKREYKPAEHKMLFVPEDINKMTDRNIIAEVLHNIGHAVYTTPVDRPLKAPQPVRMFTLLVNTIEDIRVEEQMMMDYPGVFDNFLYKFRKQDSQISSKVEGELEPHIQYVYMLQRRFRGQELLNVKPEVLQALQDSEEFLQEVYGKDKTMDMLEYVCGDLWRIFSRLIPPPEDDKDNEKQQSPEGQQLSSVGKKAVGMDAIMDKMKELSGNKPKSEGEEKEGEKGDFGKDIDAELDEKDKGKDVEHQRFEKDDEVLGHKSGGVGFTEKDREDYDSSDFVDYKTMYKNILPVLPFFVKKLSSIMTDNRYNRQGGNYRTGKLNNKKLFKLMCNSDKLFTKKIVRRHKDYAVTLLIDESGSMTSSQKNVNAATATCLFSEVLNKVGIPFEIRGFNCSDRLYKPFREKFSWVHRHNIEKIVPETCHGDGGGNNDGFAVNKASYHLNRQGDADTERILIVLSDGQPAESYRDVPREDQKRLPHNKKNYRDFDLKYEVAQASRTATCIGIGINASDVQRFYLQNVVCKDVNELPRLVISKLKGNIKRG